MPPGRGRPFAFSVEKIGALLAVRPSLPLAVAYARRYGINEFPPLPWEPPQPALLSPLLLQPTLVIRAWFPDGKAEALSPTSLWTADMSAWISAEEAQQLESRLYPAADAESPC